MRSAKIQPCSPQQEPANTGEKPTAEVWEKQTEGTGDEQTAQTETQRTTQTTGEKRTAETASPASGPKRLWPRRGIQSRMASSCPAMS